MTVEEFKKELDFLNDRVINFQPAKKYQSIPKSMTARELGLLNKNIKTERMLSGQLKHIKS
jgi:hypothetical protein